MAEPLVSVIVPVFRGERFLASTLDSVLAQTYPRIETIVVDDGSPDRSAEIAGSRAEVRLLHQENLGVAAARNSGVAAARGELLAFLDQDDVWLPEKLERQVKVLGQRPGVGMVRTHLRIELVGDTPRPSWIGADWLQQPQVGFVPSTWLVRRESFDRVGPFDGRYVISCDSEWLARAKDAGVRTVTMPEALTVWRIHGANNIYDQETARRELLRLVRSTARRQREDVNGA